MPRVIPTGVQSYSELKENNYFLIDKTMFIKDWWESGDAVTLITRPRRFGKTLNMDMLNCFFSMDYADRTDLFEGMKIWKDEKYHELQGNYPVIYLSFAGIKDGNFNDALKKIIVGLCRVREKVDCFINEECISDDDRRFVSEINPDMNKGTAEMSLNILCKVLMQKYGVKPIILIDEYDTPLQEAWIKGYWDEMMDFMRSFFNNTLKTNKYLGRAVLTGITRISKESLFSDMNNLEIASLSSDLYSEYFGFTEEEVFASMDEYGRTNKEEVKQWYDGFKIGDTSDIYNPWSVIKFLKRGKLETYWINTSKNGLVSELISGGSSCLKEDFAELMNGNTIVKAIDEQIAFSDLYEDDDAVWSLLYSSGYLKAVNTDEDEYELDIVNYEVLKYFSKMIKKWFNKTDRNYNEFVNSLLNDDLETMEECLENLALSMMSFFDGGKNESEKLSPEKFYHGFVLGLIVDLKERYVIESNRESGLGRADIIMIPKDTKNDNGIIIEFKVRSQKREKNLDETVQSALDQIERNMYSQKLIDAGVPEERICKYGFAFEGKNVKIGEHL